MEEPNETKQLPEFLRIHFRETRRLSVSALAVRIGTLIAEMKRLPDAERQRPLRIVEMIVPVTAVARVRHLRPRSFESGRLLAWKSAPTPPPTLSCRDLTRLIGARTSRNLERVSKSSWGCPSLHLAYPNGRVGDFDDGTIEDVRAAGFMSALTTLEGFNDASRGIPSDSAHQRGNDSVPVLLLACLRCSPTPAHGCICAEAEAKRPAPRPQRRFGRCAWHSLGDVGSDPLIAASRGTTRSWEAALWIAAITCWHTVARTFHPESPVFRGLEVRRLPTIRSKHLETLVHTILATVDVCFRRVNLVQFHALGSSPFAWIPRLVGKRTVVSVRGLDWQRAKWGWLARNYLADSVR